MKLKCFYTTKGLASEHIDSPQNATDSYQWSFNQCAKVQNLQRSETLNIKVAIKKPNRQTDTFHKRNTNSRHYFSKYPTTEDMQAKTPGRYFLTPVGIVGFLLIWFFIVVIKCWPKQFRVVKGFFQFTVNYRRKPKQGPRQELKLSQPKNVSYWLTECSPLYNSRLAA